METEQVLNQAAADTPGANGVDGGAPAIQAADGSTPGTDSLVAELPPELKEKEKELMRSYHEKTQALAREREALAGETTVYKQDAQALYELSKQEWFKQAVEAEKGRRSGKTMEMTPEQFEVIKADPRAFHEYLVSRDERRDAALKQQFANEISRLGNTQAELLASRELEAVTGKYGQEFTDAKNSQALKPYLDKNFDHETAFKLYMQDNGKVAGAKKPAAPLTEAERRDASVERPGMPKVRGGPVVVANNLNEALDRAFDLARRGVKDYSFTKK